METRLPIPVTLATTTRAVTSAGSARMTSCGVEGYPSVPVRILDTVYTLLYHVNVVKFATLLSYIQQKKNNIILTNSKA